MITKEEEAVLIKVNLVLNVVSGLCGLAVVVILVSIWRRDSELMDRVSIRLNMGISLVDFLKAMAILVYTEFKTDNYICVGISFSIHWLTLVYLFLNAMIALNLQLVFLCALPNNPSWESKYWAVSLVFPTLIMVIPLSFNRLGFDRATDACEFRDSLSLTSYLLLWGCFLFWIFVDGASQLPFQTSEVQRVKSDLRALIRRITFYCIIPIITQLAFAITKMYEFHSKNEMFALKLLPAVTTDIPGILNLAAFLMDPAFINACRKLHANRVKDQKGPRIQTCDLILGRCDSIHLPSIESANSFSHQASISNLPFDLNCGHVQSQSLINRFVKRL
ncbi:hypothetical protein L0F63_004510 [Massospora cicadina]|nr:hypothetical protein L0F63_004510 [Massospora cicadina]